MGAAVAVPVVTKETHAWIGNFAQVDAAGGSAHARSRPAATRSTTKDMRFRPTTAVSGDGRSTSAAPADLKDGDEVLYDDGGATAPELTGRRRHLLLRRRRRRLHTCRLYHDHALDLGGHGHLRPAPARTTASHPTDQAGVVRTSRPAFDPATAVNYGTNTITLPYDAAGGESLLTDDAVVYSSGGGTPIGGLVDGGTYYAIVSASGNPTVLQLAATRRRRRPATRTAPTAPPRSST